MMFTTKVVLASIREGVERPGFAEPYREVMFSITSEGIDPVDVRIWVHPAWPANEIEKVARSFLAGRLADMLMVTSGAAYTQYELDKIWQQVKPD